MLKVETDIGWLYNGFEIYSNVSTQCDESKTQSLKNLETTKYSSKL